MVVHVFLTQYYELYPLEWYHTMLYISVYSPKIFYPFFFWPVFFGAVGLKDTGLYRTRTTTDTGTRILPWITQSNAQSRRVAVSETTCQKVHVASRATQRQSNNCIRDQRWSYSSITCRSVRAASNHDQYNASSRGLLDGPLDCKSTAYASRRPDLHIWSLRSTRCKFSCSWPSERDQRGE